MIIIAFYKENNLIFINLIIYYSLKGIIFMARKPKNKDKGIFAEFKKFITRGNVIDLAVGVIIGGAFSAIVTALTGKIIMPIINLIINLATGGRGINLITILNGEPQFIEVDGAQTANAKCIYIDWGAFIEAIINFLLIAIVLFIIIKVINPLNERKEALEAKRLEAYYEKHPEERPVPPEPGAPVPTELDVLNEIRDLLKEQKQDKSKK